MQYDIDSSGKSLHVRGRRSQIDFVKQLVVELGNLAETSRKDTRSPHSARVTKATQSNPPAKAAGIESLFEAGEDGTTFLRVPKGPVKVVLVKELGLLMIRGRRGPE